MYALDLATHGEEEEDEEVDDQDGPVHGDVEHLEKRREQREDGGARCGQPCPRG